MRPIYFPCTWISRPMRNALFACFDQIVIYSPHSELVPETHWDLAAEGRLEIRLPKDPPGDDLPMLLESYSAWAQLHRGEHPDFHKFSTFHSSPPRDPSSRELRSQILKAGREKAPRKESAVDPLLEARLFLAIAQQYDQQQASLQNDLHRINCMQQDLFRHMTPEREEISSVKPEDPPLESDAIPRPMAAERLAAWRLLYTHHRRQAENHETPPPSGPPLLVTPDPEVFDRLKGSGAAAESVCTVSNIPLTGEEAAMAGREKIDRVLHSAAGGGPLSCAPDISLSENPEYSKCTAVLTIYRMEGDITAARFPGRNNFPVPHETTRRDGKISHTLLGCITEKLGA